MAGGPLYPLLFEPFLRPMPWGGRRLAGWVDVPFPATERIGEAWLVSDHKLHASRIVNGPLAGQTLHDLMAERSRDLLGYQAERFPLLTKLLDAEENLSVQVHPDDAAARRWAPGEGGKTEAWVVLAAEPDAALFIGLKRGVDEKTVVRELATGNLPLCLQRFHPKSGECYYVPAGTIHALGGGLVVLEIQQTSDATFRLYDWGRLDAAGKPRPLHLEAGMASWKNNAAGGLVAKGEEGVLVDCYYFTLRTARLDRPKRLSGPNIVFVVEGNGQLDGVGEVRRGTCVFMPAHCDPAELRPQSPMTLVEATIPPPR
jgi:mannose-6-phosphate isomerase